MTPATPVSGWLGEKPPQRRPYQKPTLIRYGRRKDLTSAGWAAQEPTDRGGDRAPQAIDMRNLRVLVVDDDALLRRILRDDLESSGFHVATAGDGGEAFRMIPEFNPDVVVMDVIMPGENGYRVSRAIKELGSHGMDTAPKIILLTSRRLDDDEAREEVLLGFSRADAMLYKPCDQALLLETIARVLAG